MSNLDLMKPYLSQNLRYVVIASRNFAENPEDRLAPHLDVLVPNLIPLETHMPQMIPHMDALTFYLPQLRHYMAGTKSALHHSITRTCLLHRSVDPKIG